MDAWSICKQELRGLARNVLMVLAAGTAVSAGMAQGVPDGGTWGAVTLLALPAFLLGHRERPYRPVPKGALLLIPVHLVSEAGRLLGYGMWAYPRYVLRQLLLVGRSTLVYWHYRAYQRGLQAEEARAVQELAEAQAAELRRQALEEAYDLLGLAPDADLATVKLSFRRRMREVHPDRVQHLDAAVQAQAVEAAVLLNAAYNRITTHLSSSS